MAPASALVALPIVNAAIATAVSLVIMRDVLSFKAAFT
jgi:hypothetical protein